jgi:hypothetical protein
VSEEETPNDETEETPEEKEAKNYQEFLESWNKMAGYGFPNDQENHGFVK